MLSTDYFLGLFLSWSQLWPIPAMASSIFILIVACCGERTLLHVLQLAPQVPVLVMASVFVVVGYPITFEKACRDAEEYPAPLVVDALSLIQSLWNFCLIFGVNLHDTGKFWRFFQINWINVQRFDHGQDFVHNFNIGKCSVGQRIQPVCKCLTSTLLYEVVLDRDSA